MLVLTRRVGEEIVIGGEIRVRITGVAGKRVRVGVSAPAATGIHRAELWDEAAAARPSRRSECVSTGAGNAEAGDASLLSP